MSRGRGVVARLPSRSLTFPAAQTRRARSSSARSKREGNFRFCSNSLFRAWEAASRWPEQGLRGGSCPPGSEKEDPTCRVCVNLLPTFLRPVIRRPRILRSFGPDARKPSRRLSRRGLEAARRLKSSIRNSLTAARILLAQKWKQEELPTLEEWRMKLMDYAELDKLTGRIRDRRDQRFTEDWTKFTEYLEKYL
ncbi:small integral membrane protein 3 isoform X2 [Podarcis raffonei]|uniref:small integral membrane protein 3 isoform X2 n=1 Tax=Podarcis raffonei TaxID=65483 RepID=UPI0023296032|nr:small integral membrane protein 3 isoform X2 [Podarcis raffonei]